ncbi:hypothetical protein [Carboxylicivirga sp. M1479]|uniref:hypothetical protein n=1 Tax=Carboxylicivirga sp. M1479 TaxID=2594476 RepID=UPI0011776120|nr:hypothetical protein [Carboxylicivirga sp. M1479]TRX71534.1 hypothetical protein FNN09_06065 [Carboxylicivirga sp. M1479]
MNSIKIKSLALSILILCGAQLADVQSQTKKEIQFTLDTLYSSHMKLKGDYEQLLRYWKQYDNFYQHVKTQALDASLVNEPIDKGAEHFDAVWNSLSSQMRVYEDSLIYLVDSLNRVVEERQDLLVQNKMYLNILSGKLGEAVYPNTEQELVGTWQLFLNPMQTTGDAYQSGLISHNPFTVPDSIQQHNIYQLELMADELATIYFKDGRKQKCFYEVNDFSVGKSYTIKYSKQDEFKLNMHVSPMPTGLEVSYEIPLDTTQVIYFNGVMKP